MEGERTAPSDPLTALAVLDCLEIGPLRIEPKRLTAPMSVTREGHCNRMDLIFTYEEPVLDPEDPGCRNLAGMIAAQVALNYGLFCRRMVFHGAYDETDRRFLFEMAENTAREIYVKKFLQPNPFLTEEFRSLPCLTRKTYLRADLEFPGEDSRVRARWQSWETERSRHAVLSSGGKDSLLTYALLRELERKVHPIFVNESGRHWFTALNAYRHFKEKVPNTSRVWVNSDRAFSWMLHQLPFIRQNFADIRSDEYPIRLWTVAVFLFAVLPVVRKQGIGRLLIGDEYDTTVPTRHEGIPHYDGLFDQSLQFDADLSRYFLQKGWAVSQFSILRPMSELLIEKTLVERYPDLQHLQTSCHAAHKGETRILPCGKCEKCRRMVGMLLALGADPRNCGYSEWQIRGCLATLPSKALSQEAPARAHLMHLLQERGLVDATVVAQAHPEVLALRFDSERSPLKAIPMDLRIPLLEILMSHANGALWRKGDTWLPFDPVNSREIRRPYLFEVDPLEPTEDRCRWGRLAWPDVQSYLEQVDLAILPVGAVEQHGPHLPLETDAFDAEYLSQRVAAACSDPKPLVLPLIPYGVSYHHQDFPGTLTIDNDTLAKMVYDIGLSVVRNGIRKFVILNGHGGNAPALNYAAQMINRDTHIFVCVETGESSDVDVDRLIDTPNDVHAGEVETSTCLAVRPHLVRMERAEASVPVFSSRYLDFTSRRGISWYAATRRLSDSGVLGDPGKASAAKGRRIWEIMIAHLVAFVEDLKHMSLDEIHHRHY